MPCPKKQSDLVHVYPTWGPEHDTEGLRCWCHPYHDMTEPLVIIHREPEEASH